MSVRGTMILRDLWANKGRSLLIVLAVTVGASAFGLMISGSIVLQRNLEEVYAASNPAHAVLTLGDFDADLLADVLDLPYVQLAQARRLTQARLEASPGRWLGLDLGTVPDFGAISLDRLTPGSVAPPGSILLEESLQGIATIGESLRIEMLDGQAHTLRVAGFVNDLSILPAGISRTGAGYVSPETAGILNIPADYNRLYVRFGEAVTRADIEQKLTALTDALAGRGVPVLAASVPEPGKYVLADNMTSVLFILQSLGLLTLVLSALLVTSVMSAVVARQIPQIGILKSLGARFFQMTSIYLRQVLIFGAVALALAVPIGQVGAYFLAQSVALTLNFHVPHFFLPWQTLLLQAASALLVPLLAAFAPVVAGARTTIRAAISGGGPGGAARLGRSGRNLSALPQIAKISLRNALRPDGRLALTLAALVLAGAMFIAVIGVRESLHRAVREMQAGANYDVGLTLDRPYPADQIATETLQADGVSAVETWAVAGAQLVHAPGWRSGSVLVQGVPADSVMARPGVVTGRWLEPQDRYTLFVNSDFIALSPELGAGSKVVLRIGNTEQEWTIVGVGARGVVPIAYAPIADLESVTGWQGLANRAVVATRSGSPDEQSRVQSELAARMNAAGLHVVGWETTSETREASSAQLDSIIVLLMSMVILVAVVGGLGLAITMGLNVLERTRQIGILRSLGARSGVVRRLFVVEGLAIGLASWAAAIPLSIPLAVFLGNSLGASLLKRPLDYVFSGPAVLLWLGLVAAISTLASLLPAGGAARLTIRDTLVYE